MTDQPSLHFSGGRPANDETAQAVKNKATGVADDRIHYAIAKHGPSGQFPGRIELGFKNLTRAEAAQMLLTLDKLQTDRKTALFLCNAVTLDAASAPESVAFTFARQEGLTPTKLQATAAHEFTAEHGLDLGEHFK